MQKKTKCVRRWERGVEKSRWVGSPQPRLRSPGTRAEVKIVRELER